jgi:putative membrane protein
MRRGSTFISFVGCVLAVPLCVQTQLIPGISASDLYQAVAAGIFLGVVYLVIRPILRVLTFPLGCLTFGLIHFALDIGIIFACAHFIDGFEVADFFSGALMAVLVNAVVAIAGGFGKMNK